MILNNNENEMNFVEKFSLKFFISFHFIFWQRIFFFASDKNGDDNHHHH